MGGMTDEKYEAFLRSMFRKRGVEPSIREKMLERLRREGSAAIAAAKKTTC